MWNFDLRFVFLLIINIVKSHTSIPWEWDPFDVVSDLSWMKFWFLTILSFVFSFVSIVIPLNNIVYIQVQVKNFSPTLLICFLASLFFPQLLFWYVYPIILLFFLCYACIFNMFTRFISWVQTIFSMLPDLNIFITATNREWHEEGEVEEFVNGDVGGEHV